MAGRGGDTGVDRLAKLPDDHQIVPNPLTQWTKNILPGRGQRLVRVPKRPGDAGPRCCIAIACHEYLSWLPATVIARKAWSIGTCDAFIASRNWDRLPNTTNGREMPVAGTKANIRLFTPTW